jgi:hypothetical protein
MGIPIAIRKKIREHNIFGTNTPIIEFGESVATPLGNSTHSQPQIKKLPFKKLSLTLDDDEPASTDNRI